MTRFSTCTLIAVFVLALLAPSAFAVDGTVLINQSTITNGLTGCPTGGHFPIVVCQSGSYRLSSNLTVPDAVTDAIDVTADNVTIDLNGFSILGPTVCTVTSFGVVGTCAPTGIGKGIASLNASIVVVNGQIKGMGSFGIGLIGSKSRVQNILATNNGAAGIVVANSSLVSSCTATFNGGVGIAVSDQSVLTGNIVSNNSDDGIHAGTAAVISGNSATSNGAIGIHPGCPSLISANLAVGNFIDSIRTVGSGCVLVNNAAQ